MFFLKKMPPPQYRWFGLVVFALFFVHCDGKKDIKDFYFPLKKLETPKVYEYRAVGQLADSLPILYRYFRTMVSDGTVFFTENTYDANFNVTQFTREERTESGMVLREKILYFPTPDGKTAIVKPKIASSAMFPFRVTDSNGVFVYHLQFDLPTDSTQVRLIRNRRFIRKMTFDWENKTHEAIEMRTRVADEYEKNGTLRLDSEIRDVFVKDIGLVETSQTYTGRPTVTYRLFRIYDMEELEKKAKY